MFNDSLLIICEPWLYYNRLFHKIIGDPAQQKVWNVSMFFLLFSRLLAFTWPHVLLKLREHLIVPAKLALNLRYKLCLVHTFDLIFLVPPDLIGLLDCRLDVLLKWALILREAQTQRSPQLRYALVNLRASILFLAQFDEGLAQDHIGLDVQIV